MTITAAVGKEIIKHRLELEMTLLKIAREHSERCREEGDPCQWQPGWLDGVLCDLEKSLELYHARMRAAA